MTKVENVTNPGIKAYLFPEMDGYWPQREFKQRKFKPGQYFTLGTQSHTG